MRLVTSRGCGIFTIQTRDNKPSTSSFIFSVKGYTSSAPTHNNSGLAAPTPRISICYRPLKACWCVSPAAAAQLCVVFSGWYPLLSPQLHGSTLLTAIHRAVLQFSHPSAPVAALQYSSHSCQGCCSDAFRVA